MLQFIFQFFLKTIFRLKGWKIDESLGKLSEVRKCLIVSAPHTSNWDFIFTMAVFSLLKMPVRFTIKDEWMKFPYNLVMGPLGALAINLRPKFAKKKLTMVDAMVNLFTENEELIILITPEASRQKVTRWKNGFYKVAQGANIPILIGYLDYKKKTGGLHSQIMVTGDYKKDMREAMDFYKTVTPCKPDQFSVDTRVYKEN